jgi:hypothetical protein
VLSLFAFHSAAFFHNPFSPFLLQLSHTVLSLLRFPFFFCSFPFALLPCLAFLFLSCSTYPCSLSLVFSVLFFLSFSSVLHVLSLLLHIFFYLFFLSCLTLPFHFSLSHCLSCTFFPPLSYLSFFLFCPSFLLCPSCPFYSSLSYLSFQFFSVLPVLSILFCPTCPFYSSLSYLSFLFFSVLPVLIFLSVLPVLSILLLLLVHWWCLRTVSCAKLHSASLKCLVCQDCENQTNLFAIAN